jgi:hypothetical protein
MIVTVDGAPVLRVSLRGRPVIVLQQTAEPLTTYDAPVAWRWSRAMCTDILHFPARVLVIQAARVATGERG